MKYTHGGYIPYEYEWKDCYQCGIQDIPVRKNREVCDDCLAVASNPDTIGSPQHEIKKYGLEGKGQSGVNPADYPPGTWFYYPGDGQCYVREV